MDPARARLGSEHSHGLARQIHRGLRAQSQTIPMDLGLYVLAGSLLVPALLPCVQSVSPLHVLARL